MLMIDIILLPEFKEGMVISTQILVAVILIATVLSVVIWAILRMTRKGHYELWTEAGEKIRDYRKEKDYCNSWNVYPRPQMKRDGYMMLNENWKLNGNPISMPFPPQSMLSDYSYNVSAKLQYETIIRIPKNFTKEKILLHFGAVDQVAEVYINDRFVIKHEGGYLPFSADITEYVSHDKDNKLVVKVIDTLSKEYPYGKQCKKRGGMWYTPVSGIWQSVWIENVPGKYIENLTIKPDLKGINLSIDGAGIDEFWVEIKLSNQETVRKHFTGGYARIELSEHVCSDGSNYKPKIWSTSQPYLYEMNIKTESDSVDTYFALRKIEIQNINGINRVCLNDTPVFLHGVLDQGYYPDGIFLPAEPQEYERDILRMKELGFNFLRKHIKVEPECFYYFCDRHGMLVMQDMVNNGEYSFIRDTALPTIGMKNRKDTGGKNSKTRENFRKHTVETIKHLYNHPCIIAYTIFNEGWGQFESDSMYEMVKALDDSRLVDSTSGWFTQQKNDFDSKHIYFKCIELDVKERPLFVSECGGYSSIEEGHFFNKYNTYGYGKAKDAEELTKMITDMYEKMILPGISKGVCGCVYTQLSDVEDEVNGIYTYDRKICKVIKENIQDISKKIVELLEVVKD